MGRNAGFAPAVNRGIRESRTDRIAVLNSDVELAPDYLATLAAADGWFATGKLLHRAEPAELAHSPKVAPVIDGTFDAMCRGGTAWRVGNGRADGPPFSLTHSIFSPPWTAALFRAELFERVGYLEESFESYLEDVDFGLRCARLGLAGSYVPSAVAWHRGSATLGRWHPDTVRRMTRNQILLLARHYPGRLLLRCWWPIFVAHSLWAALAFRHGRGLACLRGVSQGIRGISTARLTDEPSGSGLLELLRVNEQTIRDVQASTGFDTYWRLYFLLTGIGAR
jgi:GT2 family glycosyltransferase